MIDSFIIYPDRSTWTDDTLYYSEETNSTWALYKRNYTNDYTTANGLPYEYHPMKIMAVPKANSGYWPDENHGKFMVDSMNAKVKEKNDEVAWVEKVVVNPMLYTGPKLPVAASISMCPPDPKDGSYGAVRWAATHVPTKKWLHMPVATKEDVIQWCKLRGIHVLGA
jgi:hypothetical protein